MPQCGVAAPGYRWAAVAAARGSVQDAEERSDGQALAQLDPRLQLFPRPAVHSDLAAFAALALAHEDRAAVWIEVGLGECERFAYAKAGTPQHDDEPSEPEPRRPHHRRRASQR